LEDYMLCIQVTVAKKDHQCKDSFHLPIF